MAAIDKPEPLMYFSFTKVLVFYLLFFLYSSSFIFFVSSEIQSHQFGHRRLNLELENENHQQSPKKKSSNLSPTNQTKLIKSSNLSTKNKTKLNNSDLNSKNQTKIIKPKPNLSAKNQTRLINPNLPVKNQTKVSKSKIEVKKLHNSTKTSSDLQKLGSSKNKTTKSTPKNDSKPNSTKKLNYPDHKKQDKNRNQQPSWLDLQEEQDLVSEFRDLPSRFQQTLLPDLERISITSKKYLTKANKQITKGFKPYVGNKYASTIASFVSFAFILIPLLLVSVIINHFKAYLSLQKILIFVQVYLSIYFTILCVSSVATGVDSLKFFYMTSQSTYVCVTVMQAVCYVLYLLLALVYFIFVFSTNCGLGSRLLGLGQFFVGFAIGLHYYVAVFHRVVMHQQPKTNWKVHGVYATCFLVICLFAKAERRKKAYLEDGGEEGKKS